MDMASSLRFVTSNLLTRSILRFRPTLVSSSRSHSIIAGHQSYSTDLCEQSWPKTLLPEISSMSFDIIINKETTWFFLHMPELVNINDYEGVSIHLHTPPINLKEMRACAKHNALLIKSPDMMITGSDHMIKEDQKKDGMLDHEVTLPDKDTIMANIIADIITSVQDISAKRSWVYYDLFFDRSILGKGLCPLLGMLSPINSFSIYKKETAKHLKIAMNMPGNEYMKLTTQGIRLSLPMRGLERKDIKIFFDYNTLFIEGKGNAIHYITCIRLPEGIRKKHNMIRRHMEDGTLYAFIPCKKKEEIKII